MSRAVVCARGVHTPYVRAGRGEPIVLLASDVDAADVQEMIESLARHALVVAAAPVTVKSEDLASWLRDFLDGLGMTRAHVLVHASLATLLTSL